jgi:hypothetical protein
MGLRGDGDATCVARRVLFCSLDFWCQWSVKVRSFGVEMAAD